MSRTPFHWDDPLLLDQQLRDDERAVRDAARSYCQERLAPRVVEAFLPHGPAANDEPACRARSSRRYPPCTAPGHTSARRHHDERA